MGQSMENGMVLVMSLWDDYAANMLWLDSSYPVGADDSAPGVKRGPCSKDSGKPSDVENQQPNASVTYSNIRVGEFCTTHADSEDKLCAKNYRGNYLAKTMGAKKQKLQSPIYV